MITVHIQERVQGVEPVNVLQALEIVLDKTKFFGTISLTYEAGQLKFIKAQQTFTVDSLVDYLSK